MPDRRTSTQARTEDRLRDGSGDRPGNAASIAPPRRRRGFGLSARVLAFTILFVMVAEVLVYVPGVANFRVSWLADRVALADAASTVIRQTVSVDVPRDVQDEVLKAVWASLIVVRDESVSRLIATVEDPPTVDRIVDLRSGDPVSDIVDAFETLLAREPQTLRVIGTARGGETIEILIGDRGLRRAMVAYSANVLWLSALLSVVTAVFLYLVIRSLLVRPMRSISANMVAFSRAPERPDLIIQPSGRADEIGVAEERLAAMQSTLQETLRDQRHLADLGLAVSKVNHDLRNMLASAQLFSDRIGSLPDPSVQRFAPKLIAALDRAIAYCQSTLAYGRAREDAPTRRLVRLDTLVDEVAEAVGLVAHPTIAWENAVPSGLEIDADPEQLFRILVNLARNAVQALEADSDPAVVRRLGIAAERANGGVCITVRDTGPGVPAAVRETLFQAFHGSVKAGGSGLGLAIASELVQAHGGAIELAETDTPGATFRIEIPDRTPRNARRNGA